MYLNYWNLKKAPFQSGLSLESYYPAPSSEEALSRIEYLVTQQRRMGLLLGETGCGKSLVLQKAKQLLRKSGGDIARVEAYGCNTHDFLWQVAKKLKTRVTKNDTSIQLWERIEDRLIENEYLDRKTVLLIDDIAETGIDVWTQVVRLLRLAPTNKAWTVIVASQVTEAQRLPMPLLQSVDLKIEMYPWNAEVTFGFIQNGMQKAEASKPIFTDEAVQMIYEITSGIPRQIAKLAEYSLVSGAGCDAKVVDQNIVQMALEASVWEQPAAGYTAEIVEMNG